MRLLIVSMLMLGLTMIVSPLLISTIVNIVEQYFFFINYLFNYRAFGAIIFLGGLLILLKHRNRKTKKTISCPYCAEKINNIEIKCKHCKSILRVRKFNSSDYWNPALYYFFEGGVPVINQWAVADFVLDRLTTSNGIFGEQLKIKDQERINKLVSEMPAVIRVDFLSCYSQFMDISS